MKITSFITGLAVGAVAALFVSKKLNGCDCDCDCDLEPQDVSEAKEEPKPENI